jgi:putative tricarboxylic transport membrane protein
MERMKVKYSVCFSYIMFLLSIASLSARGTQEVGFVPTTTVEVVVPAAEGGGSDMLATTIVDIALQHRLTEVPLTIVHRPGGSGSAGFAYASSRPEPDHTLMVVNTPHLLVLHDGGKDRHLVPIARLAVDPILFVVPADSPYEDFNDLSTRIESVDLLVGTADSFDRYCVMQLNAKLAGNLRTIYYNSSSFIVTGMIHGQLDAGILNPAEAVEGIASGNLRVLAAFTSIFPSDMVPEVPTFAELGIEGLDYEISRYVMGPPDMSSEARVYWHGLFSSLVQEPDWIDGYIRANLLSEAFLDMDATEAYLTNEELPWVREIWKSGFLR